MPRPAHFVDKELGKVLLDEYLGESLKAAGYAGMDLVATPIGTKITVRALRPGLVIGRRGSRIREVSRMIEEEFNYRNPSVSVEEVEIPEFEPRIMVSQVTRALARGYKYRRVGFWVLRTIMESGAAGAEIVISGKLRTVRSRYEKFSAGVLLKSGDLVERFVRKAKASVVLKQGKVGVKVSVAPASPEYEAAIGKRSTVLAESDLGEAETEEPKER